MVSEYATNAVVATGPGRKPDGDGALYDDTPPLFGVRPRRTATHLLLEVSDVSTDPPVPKAAGELDETSRDLALVIAEAGHVGYHLTPAGKVVWDLTKATPACAAVSA